MIAHFDTSAFVPLLVVEPTSAAEIDQILVESAAGLAARYELRGYDAVHCASAQQLEGDDLVAASGDRRLLRAWAELGLSTFDPNDANE